MAFNFEQYGVHNPKTYGAGSASLNASHNADLIYQNIIGRNMDSGGRDYWTKQIASKGDGGYQDMVNSLLASKEYKDRLTAKTANPNITEHELDRLSSAYVTPFHSGSGSAVSNWKPGDPLTLEMARAVATTESNADGTQKLDSDGNNIVKASYDDQTNQDVDDVIAHIKAKSGIDLTGTGVISGGNQSGGEILKALGLVGADGATGATGPAGKDGKDGLTEAEILALIAKHGGGSSTTTGGGGSGFDMNSFMQMMMMMNMMGGSRGGSQYGYGGLNPGGVSQAFDYKDMATWMKDTFGSGSSGGTTAALNV